MTKKKILLLGATGMAGHVAYHYLKETNKYEIVDVVFRNKLPADSIVLDVTDKHATEELIKTVNPDIILNCIGILIKGSRQHPDNAIYINAYFPHLLERLSSEINAKLIHISTDCVFSGKKGNYSEYDFKDADDIYGRSKALGEVDNDRDLTLRTSIIGPELKQNGEGLFHWFMHQEGKINGFTDAIWGGVTTLELAKAIDKAIDNNLTGLVHLSNGTGINKYDLLNLFKSIWIRNNIDINPFEGHAVDKSLQSSTKFNMNVPSYSAMLDELKNWMDNHKSIYNQYC
ncbi:MAG: SDR family oxidoreductase [Proteiniphilum sp.]